MNPPANTPATATTGMEWGVRQSFLRYLSRVPDSMSSVTDGARLTDSGIYSYALLSEYGDDIRGTVQCKGSVRFSAHGGSLRLGFTDPAISYTGPDAILNVIDHFDQTPGARIDLVHGTLRREQLTDSHDRLHISDVRLTDPGAEFFHTMYQPGDAFDDILIILPRRKNRSRQ